mmetsp:Transcript_11790/g.38804  ORF Transcript_11790/g.38804 Transcript_11790/m.38804 type:complete len:241 (+) Transcript_11790:2941-3663(+)
MHRHNREAPALRVNPLRDARLNGARALRLDAAGGPRDRLLRRLGRLPLLGRRGDGRMEGWQRGRRPHAHVLRRQPAVHCEGTSRGPCLPGAARRQRGPTAEESVQVAAALPPAVRYCGHRRGARDATPHPRHQLVGQQAVGHRCGGRGAADARHQRLHRHCKDAGDHDALQGEGGSAQRLVGGGTARRLLAPTLSLCAGRLLGQTCHPRARIAVVREKDPDVGMDAALHCAQVHLDGALA